MSELLKMYRDAQKEYEKFVRYIATSPGGPMPYYDLYLDQYAEKDQIFVKRILELEAENAALKEERRWKYSEVEFPILDQDVLIVNEWGDVYHGHFFDMYEGSEDEQEIEFDPADADIDPGVDKFYWKYEPLPEVTE